MDHYLISNKNTDLHFLESGCTFFDTPMLKKDCFTHFVNLEDLLVDNLESKLLKTIYVQEGNHSENYNNPKKGSFLNESLQSQGCEDTELDFSLLDDIEPMITPINTGGATVYPQTSLPIEPPSMNNNFIMPFVPHLHDSSRIQTSDNVGFLVETPPDSPVSQVPDVLGFSRILGSPKISHWDNCENIKGQTLSNLFLPWNPSPSYSSGAPSPMASVRQQNISSSYPSGSVDLAGISLGEPNNAGILESKGPNDFCGLDSFDLANTSQMEVSKLIQPTYVTAFPRCSKINESESVVSRGTIFSPSTTYLNLLSTTQRQRPQTKYLPNDYTTKILHTETRRNRKKLQNKEAATRYRIKKREASQWLQDEKNRLAAKNSELRNKLRKLKNEIMYLKNLSREILSQKMSTGS